MNEKQDLQNNREENRVIYHQRFTAEFSGPLPSPSILEEYDKIVPGAANRILVMAEEQSKHRRILEAKFIGSNIENSRLGLRRGLIIGPTGIIFAAVYNNSILGIGTLTSLVGVFVYGSQQRKRERKDARSGK